MNAFRRPPGMARLGAAPQTTTSTTGFPWLDGDMLYAADLNNAFIGRDTAISGMLPLAGGTMTGPLTLAGDATAPLQPVSLQQLTAIAGGPYLPLSGGTVTGDLHVTTNLDADTGVFGGIAYPGMRAGGAALTWVGKSNNYYMQYYDIYALAAFYPPPAYAIAAAAAVRSSDRPLGTATANIAYAAYATSDAANINCGPTWGYYGSTQRVTGARTTCGAEFSTGNLGSTIEINPYKLNNDGLSLGLWLSSGSEAFAGGLNPNPASLAIGIASNGSTWAKGIMVAHDALLPDGAGHQKAMQLPTKAEIQWTFDATGTRSSFIRCDATAASVGVVFANSTFNVTDSAETINLLQVTPTVTNLSVGLSFAVQPSNATDLSKALRFFNGGGINGYGNYVNLSAPTSGGYQFFVGGTPEAVLDATGLNYCAIGQTGIAPGSFSTLSATSTTTFSGATTFSGTVGGAALTTYLASPPAIGSTAQNTGVFSTLGSIGALTIGPGGGLHINGTVAAPPDVTKHIELYTGAGYGFSISAGQQNYIVPSGAVHMFYVAAASRFTVSATGLGFNGAAAIAKPTGWAAATGTATRSTFITSSVLLPALAEHVKALIDDLIAYGLIGP